MMPAAQALLSEFENAAQTAQQAEALLRKKMTEEIARLERQRAFAFRRVRLIRALADGGAGADTEEAALSGQVRTLCEELDWVGTGESQQEVLKQLEPVGRAVWECGCGADGATPANVAAELEVFERWHERARGVPFYNLFDQYVPEVPVVDF